MEQGYLNSVIELFDKEMHTNSEDLNELLIDALNQCAVMNEKTDDELQLAQKIADEIQEKATSENDTRSTPMLNKVAAEAAYSVGIKFVRLKGCPQTARYMQHAKQAAPPLYYSRGDEWAKKCALNRQLFSQIKPQFESQILLRNKRFGSVSGSFAYTTQNSSLDQYTALHEVNYTVTFTKQSSGGYAAVYNITDVYDFKWGRYDSIQVGLGNNYCYMMQELGLIRPFKISIVYNA